MAPPLSYDQNGILGFKTILLKGLDMKIDNLNKMIGGWFIGNFEP